MDKNEEPDEDYEDTAGQQYNSKTSNDRRTFPLKGFQLDDLSKT